MKSKNMFIVNLVVTCITCAVLIFSCGGCTPEQAQQFKDTMGVTQTAVHTMPVEVQSQPWYVFVLLASDIASSIAAAWLVYKKQNGVQSGQN